MATDPGGQDAQHTTSSTEQSLLTLPLEMFDAIAGEVDPNDLLNLRLVNKETRDKVDSTFMRVHFTDRAFLLAYRSSSETLQKIASHPKFGRALKTIILCSDGLPTFPSRSRRSKSFHSLTVEHEEKDPIASKILSELQEREWKRLDRETRQFDDEAMLVQVLETFLSVGNIPAIRLTDCDTAKMNAHGERTVQLLSGQHMDRYKNVGDNRKVPVLCRSLTDAGFALTSLDINLSIFACTFARFAADLSVQECVSGVFQRLKFLKLRVEGETGAVTMEDAIANAAIFRACRALEDVTLEVSAFDKDTLWMNDSFIAAFFSQVMPELAALKLHGFRIRAEQLVAFVRQHSKLNKLTLWFRCVTCLFGLSCDSLRNHDQRNERVKRILQTATGLQDIAVDACEDMPWGLENLANAWDSTQDIAELA